MSRTPAATATLLCFSLLSGVHLAAQSAPIPRSGVVMAPLSNNSNVRSQAPLQANASSGSTLTFEQLLRFPAEQQNIASKLQNLSLFDWKSMSDGYFRDYFFGADTVIQNAQDGDSFSAVATAPFGPVDIPPITFHASYNGSTNCFVGQSVVCGSTSQEVIWFTSGQGNDGTWSFQLFVNNAQVASSPSFYVHPRIPPLAVPAPGTAVYKQGNYPTDSYDTDCYTLDAQNHKSKPFHCDGRQGELPFSITAKGCALSSGAMLITYHGYSAAPSFSVTPDVLNVFLDDDLAGNSLNGGYDFDGSVNWTGLTDFASQRGSSLTQLTVPVKCSDGGCNDAGLLQAISTYGPQIVAVNEDGGRYTDPKSPWRGYLIREHWVIIVGQDDAKTIWYIEDPATGQESSIPGTQSNRRNLNYSNYLAVRPFRGPLFPNPPNVLNVKLFSPAELLLTDPSGHRQGADNNTFYTEIPGADYFSSNLYDDDAVDAGLVPDPAPQVRELTVVQPQQGTYTVAVTGTDTGTYSMPVYLTDQNSVTNFAELDNIPTYAGLVHQYTFTYSSPFSSSTPGPVTISGALPSNGSNPDANFFLTFASPVVSATLLPAGVNNFPLVIFYGPTTDPTSFTASLNGQDIHRLFSAAPGTAQAVNLPLPSGQSTLNLQINGTTSSGQVATDMETLLFDVGGSVPTAPGGLIASAVSTTQINLSWTASTSNGITYSIFRSTTRGFTPSPSNQIASGINTTSYSDTGLAAFTKYFYVVEAIDPFASSPASNQATARTQPIVTGGAVSSITSNFNGTAIPGGDYIWFSSVLQPKSLGTSPVMIFVRNSTITLTANGTNYTIPVPDADITFDPNATTATTSFTASNALWETFVPSKSLAGNTLLDAVAFPVPSGGLPGGIKNVTWTASFSTDTAGVSLQWEWSAAVYTAFTAAYNALGVKPVDDNKASQYQNSDHAGTPENYKTSVTGGASGGGGSNFTGSNSGTTSVNPVLVTSSGGGGGGPS